MVFENGLINIQAEAYNGARTVCKRKEFKLFQLLENFKKIYANAPSSS